MNDNNEKKPIMGKICIIMILILIAMAGAVFVMSKRLGNNNAEDKKESNLKIDDFVITPAEGIVLGEKVNLTATVSGNEGECTYTFKCLKDNVDEREIIKDSPSNTVEIADLEVGKYIFTVEVKDGAGTSREKEIVGYQVSGIENIELKTSIESGRAKIGDVINLSVNIEDDITTFGKLKYKYTITKVDNENEKYEIDGDENGNAIWSSSVGGKFNIKLEILKEDDSTLAEKTIENFEIIEEKLAENDIIVYYKGIDKPKMCCLLTDGQVQEVEMNKEKIQDATISKYYDGEAYVAKIKIDTQKIKVYFKNDKNEQDNANGQNYECTSENKEGNFIKDNKIVNFASLPKSDSENANGELKNKAGDKEVVVYFDGIEEPNFKYTQKGKDKWKKIDMEKADEDGVKNGYNYCAKVKVKDGEEIEANFYASNGGSEKEDNNGQNFVFKKGKTYYVKKGGSVTEGK